MSAVVKLGRATRAALACLANTLESGAFGVSAGEVGEAVWPHRRSRGTSNGGGGDYAAQMLLGRMKKLGLVRHAPSVGSSLWEITRAGLAELAKVAS